MGSRDSLADVIARQASQLLAVPGVVGLAESESDGQPCILVLVARASDLTQPLPGDLEGYPVRILESGEIKALDAE